MTERIEAIGWVLVDLIYDLCGSAMLYRENIGNAEFDPSIDHRALSIRRVCQTSSMIGLSRLWELLDGFGKEVHEAPEPLRSKLLELKQTIEKKKIYQFRSKYIGHVFDKSSKLPIKISDARPLLEHIVGTSWVDFYDWIYPGSHRDYSSSVVGTIEEFKNYCGTIIQPTSRP